MKNASGIILIFLVLMSQGCMTLQKGTVGREPQIKPTPTAPLSAEIERKIEFFSQLLETKDLSEHDRQIATDILDTYKHLSTVSSADNCQGNIQRLLRSLALIDESYFSREMSVDEDSVRIIDSFTKKRDQIFNAYASGDYQDVIDRCIDLKAGFGPDALTGDIATLFAISLSEKGMIQEAISIGEGISQKDMTGLDPTQLKIHIAEWYFQQGQRDAAMSALSKAENDIEEKEIDLFMLKKKLDRKERVGNAMESDRKSIPNPDGAETLDRVLSEVETRLGENRFSEARELLLNQKNSELLQSDPQTLHRALRKIELAEENFLERKISMLSVSRDMEQARGLLAEEKYEDAISKLDMMEKQEGGNHEIRELKQFATEKLINRERNRAAQIYLNAKQTQDASQKEAYLKESLEILRGLVDRFPDSPLHQKLASHVRTVEEELRMLHKGE